jgi:hypothetical protein
MTVKLKGTLAVRTIPGRFGPFNVGVLTSPEGEFSVKDKQLETLEEGSYKGEFLIKEFRINCYFSSGRMVSELRVDLNDMKLDNVSDLSQEEAERVEKTETPDPLSEEEPSKVPPKKEESKSAQPYRKKVKEDKSNDMELFGALYPLELSVKLDSTCDRDTLRKQRVRLQELGYRVDPRTQTWNRSDHQTEDAGEEAFA